MQVSVFKAICVLVAHIVIEACFPWAAVCRDSVNRSRAGSIRVGMTLIEMLISVCIIVALMGLLLPAISVVRERMRVAKAGEQIAELHMALQHYASEDRRHRYPPQTGPADHTLRLDPDDSAIGNLNLMRQFGFECGITGLERTGSPPYVLADPWHRPYQYQVDEDLLGHAVAQRPQPPEICPSWNAAGIRPWGYLWSLGKREAVDGDGWIYVQDDR